METQTHKETKKIYGLSEFDRRVIEVLRCLVPDQKMTLQDSQSGIWQSSCEQHEDEAITYIRRNGETIVVIKYNYTTCEEQAVYF